MVIKDRLAELQEVSNNRQLYSPQSERSNNTHDTTTINLGFESEDTNKANPFFNETTEDNLFLTEIEDLKREIFILTESIVELKKLYNGIINPSIHAEEQELRDQATQFKLDCDSQVSKINNILRKMKMTMDEEEKLSIDAVSGKPILTAEIKARKNHYNVAAIKFKEALQEYENAQQSYKDRIKSKLKREMQIIDGFHQFNDEEVDEMIESGTLNIFDEGFLRAQENKEIISKLEKRAQDMMQLEKSMLELRNIFVQLQQMVEDQGYTINNIADNVEATEARAEHAVEELRSAARYQTSARRKKIFILVCCIILIIILIVVLCATLIPKFSSN